MSGRVLILAPFSAFSDAYSVSAAAAEQARALAAAGVPVAVACPSDCRLTGPAADAPHLFHRILAPMHATGTALDEVAVERWRATIVAALESLRPSVVIGHDTVFLMQYADVAAALHRIGPTPGVRWCHVAHSNVSRQPAPPQTPVERAARRLPDGHMVAGITREHAQRLPAYYGVAPDRVCVLPNVIDAGRLGGSPIASGLAERWRLAERDIVGILPACSTRLLAKGGPQAARAFSALRAAGHDAVLVMAAFHANQTNSVNPIMATREAATNGALLWVHEALPEVAQTGLDRRDLWALMHWCDALVLPTQGEASSSVAAEAALAGLAVLACDMAPAVAEYAPGAQLLPWYRASPEDMAAAVRDAMNLPGQRARRGVLKRCSAAGVVRAVRTLMEGGRPW